MIATDPLRCHVCNEDLDCAENDPDVHYCSVECAIENEDADERFGLVQTTARPWDAERGRDSDGCWSWIVRVPGWATVRRWQVVWVRFAGDPKPRRARVRTNPWWSRFGGRRVYAFPATA